MLYARGAQKVRDSNEKIEVEEGEAITEDLACVSQKVTIAQCAPGIFNLDLKVQT